MMLNDSYIVILIQLTSMVFQHSPYCQVTFVVYDLEGEKPKNIVPYIYIYMYSFRFILAITLLILHDIANLNI